MRKQRTSFQTQLNKRMLDAAMKDWIVIYRHDWRFDLGPTVNTPALQRDSQVLLPTSQWPFDHSMVSTHLLVRKTPALGMSIMGQSGHLGEKTSPSTSSASTSSRCCCSVASISFDSSVHKVRNASASWL